LAGVTAIAAGAHHVCAIIGANTVSCWGYNDFGQLGELTTMDSPTPVAISGIANATELSAGGADNCVLLPDGSVLCWGYNAHGKLGIGDASTMVSPSPVRVALQ